jgi:hypothetical protein
MEASKKNENIDSNFFNAYDLIEARDSSSPQTIKRRLRASVSTTPSK